MIERRLDQLFLRPSGGGTEALLVLESPAGARTRVRLPLDVREPERAVALVARHLARRPELISIDRLRLRVERGGELRDRPDLVRHLRNALRSEED